MKVLIAIIVTLVESSVANPVNTQNSVNGSVKIQYSEGLLECVVKYYKNTSYVISWYRDNKLVSGNEYLKLNSDKNQLQLKDVSKVFGNYKCKLVDKTGSLYSKTIQVKSESFITVELLDEKLENVSVEMNSTGVKKFHARCLVHSNPNANVTFLRNGNSIKTNERISIEEIKQDTGVIYELTVEKVSNADVGEYHCRATNGLLSRRILIGIVFLKGECSTKNHWTCLHDSEKCIPKTECTLVDCLLYNCERPSQPIVQTTNIGYDRISLAWRKDRKAMKYTVIVDTLNTYSRTYYTTEGAYTVEGLNNNTAYTITVYGANNAGMSRDEHIFIKTKRMVRPQIIQNIKWVRKDDLSIQVKWDTPKDDGMENIDGDLLYKTSHCLYNNRTKLSCIHKITNDTSLDIENVNHNTLYMFSVTTINKAYQSGPMKNMYYRTGIATSTGTILTFNIIGSIMLTSTFYYSLVYLI